MNRFQLLEYMRALTPFPADMSHAIQVEEYLDFVFPDWETDYDWVNDKAIREDITNMLVPF
jgi:hypothetical protein